MKDHYIVLRIAATGCEIARRRVTGDADKHQNVIDEIAAYKADLVEQMHRWENSDQFIGRPLEVVVL